MLSTNRKYFLSLPFQYVINWIPDYELTLSSLLPEKL